MLAEVNYQVIYSILSITTHAGFTHTHTHKQRHRDKVDHSFSAASFLTCMWILFVKLEQTDLFVFYLNFFLRPFYFASDTLFEISGVSGSNKCFDFHKWKQKPHCTQFTHRKKVTAILLYFSTRFFVDSLTTDLVLDTSVVATEKMQNNVWVYIKKSPSNKGQETLEQAACLKASK